MNPLEVMATHATVVLRLLPRRIGHINCLQNSPSTAHGCGEEGGVGLMTSKGTHPSCCSFPTQARWSLATSLVKLSAPHCPAGLQP